MSTSCLKTKQQERMKYTAVKGCIIAKKEDDSEIISELIDEVHIRKHNLEIILSSFRINNRAKSFLPTFSEQQRRHTLEEPSDPAASC